LFFLPKWQNLVSRTDTLELLTAISQDEKTQVVVRGHLRAEAATISDAERASLESPHLVFVSDDVSSASLIKACDVIVDVDSSIAFDAVILGKPYVRPRYLQDASVSTIWDELGGAHQTNSQQETLALLAQGQLLPAPRSEAFDDVVFGGPGLEVLARYRDELASIAYGTTNPR
jgi:spore coat polysaccharide biosynthesis predicted glycosyltransferase SpsG